MIETFGYVNAGSGWRQTGGRGSQGRNRVHSDHSERKTYRDIRAYGSTPALIVQNAFPCYYCDQYFMEASRNGECIIIKVTDNQGGYSADLNLSARAAVPSILYYYNGDCTMVGLWSRSAGYAPYGFPSHPEFDHL